MINKYDHKNVSTTQILYSFLIKLGIHFFNVST